MIQSCYNDFDMYKVLFEGTFEAARCVCEMSIARALRGATGAASAAAELFNAFKLIVSV
jgi:hypothetical protein